MAVTQQALPSPEDFKIVTVRCSGKDLGGWFSLHRGIVHVSYHEDQVSYDPNKKVYWVYTVLYEPKEEGGRNVNVVYKWDYEE